MPTIRDLRPMLNVNDIAETTAFWEKLGFQVINTMTDDSGKPTWSQVDRDGVKVMFSWSEPHTHDDGSEHAHGPALSGALYIDVDDVDAIYAELQGKGVKTINEPTDQPWGMRDFVIADPNEFDIIFGQPTEG